MTTQAIQTHGARPTPDLAPGDEAKQQGREGQPTPSTASTRGKSPLARSDIDPVEIGAPPEGMLSSHGAAAGQDPVPSIRPLGAIPVSDITPDPNQPRKEFDHDKLADLAETIRAHGVIQPVVLRRNPAASADDDETGPPPWILVSGERRWRAAPLAGLDSLPACEMRYQSDRQVAAAALIENVQREDLNPIEIANHLHELRRQGYSNVELGTLIGEATKGTVSKLLSLVGLPESTRDAIRAGKLSKSHGYLLSAAPPAHIERLTEEVIAEEWSVTRLKNAIDALNKPAKKRRERAARARGKPAVDPNTQRVITRLGEQYGTTVRLEPRKLGGLLILKYHGTEELNGILEKMGYRDDA